MLDYEARHIIGEDLPGHRRTTRRRRDQPVIGVLGVLGLGTLEVEATGEAQRVHNEVNRRRLAGDHRPVARPIALELTPGLRFEADRRAARAVAPRLGWR